MIDVIKLCEDSHRISKDKGWLEGPKRSYAGVNALIHSELSEALEDYRKNKAINEVWYEHPKDPKTTYTAAQRADMLRGGSTVADFKPAGIPNELADVIIRIAQHCGTEGHEQLLQKEVAISEKDQKFAAKDFEDLVAKCHLAVSLSFLSEHRGANVTNTVSALADCWELIETFCKKNDIDLEAAVIEKQAFNETRSHRHGNKKI